MPTLAWQRVQNDVTVIMFCEKLEHYHHLNFVAGACTVLGNEALEKKKKVSFLQMKSYRMTKLTPFHLMQQISRQAYTQLQKKINKNQLAGTAN